MFESSRKEFRVGGSPGLIFGYDPDKEQCRWTGPLMVDRFSSCKFPAKLLSLAFCWAHARRDFVEAQAGATEDQVAWAGEWIESERFDRPLSEAVGVQVESGRYKDISAALQDAAWHYFFGSPSLFEEYDVTPDQVERTAQRDLEQIRRDRKAGKLKR
ncbi:MAG: transposase [Verrucomicrobia bacterium]|nr:transposase [Verrucomicrobiota bacterium]